MSPEPEATGGGSTAFPAPPGAEAPKAPAAPAEKVVDEFGYEVDPAAAKPPEKKAEPKKDEPAPEGVKEPATGYDKEPEAGDPPEKKVEASKEKDDKADEKPDEFDVKDPGDLLPDEVGEIKDFVKKHKLSKEVGQAMVEAKKAEVKKLQSTMAAQKAKAEAIVKETKAKWYKELKEDPNFGKDKFDFNVKRVDKLLDEHMPNTKKTLTERKSMLPPYVMRDLLTLANSLYSTEKIVHGNPTVIKPNSDKDENDPLAFYN